MPPPAPGTHPTPAPVVRRFGKYYLVRKLAEGGMAEIFLAKQVGEEGFERNVVIKRMLQHLSSVPDMVSMFLDEAKLAAKLMHQNIVQIHDLGLVEGSYFICMEYVPGEDFASVLALARRKSEYVPLVVALKVVTDAAAGLHYAHEFRDEMGRPLNIVHRDISPANLFISYSGQVKVLDFGIAKAESRAVKTTAGVVKGKYMYMAPEQARGEAVDRRADVFSLGLCLYEALTNVRPYSRDNDLAILNAVLKANIKPIRQLRPELPAELEAVVMRSLAPKLEDRYPSAGALMADLEKFVAGTTSASGGAQIATYLKMVFGEERILSRTVIPKLADFGQSLPAGQGVHPEAKTSSELRSIPTIASSPRRPSSPTQPTALSAPAGGTKRVGLVAGLAAVVLALGAAGAYAYLHRGTDLAAKAVADVPPPTPIAISSPPLTPSPTRPAVSPVKPTPSEEPSTEEAVVHHHHPIVLGAREIQQVVNRGRASILHCFETHKGDLPGTDGQVTVKFSILSSGKVADASIPGPLGDKPVGRCLEDRVSHLRFPLHKDKSISLGLPFAYHVQH